MGTFDAGFDLEGSLGREVGVSAAGLEPEGDRSDHLGVGVGEDAASGLQKHRQVLAMEPVEIDRAESVTVHMDQSTSVANPTTAH